MIGVVFEEYGIRISRDDVGLVIAYDSGGSAGGYLIRKHISEQQARQAMESENAAYAVLIAMAGEAEIS